MPDYAVAGVPPYPEDDAALHHVFDDGWMWVLRFGNGVTSAGVAVRDRLAADLRLADGEPAWHRLLRRYPSIAAQFAGAQAIREFTWMPRLAYRAARAAGARWTMLPSAAAFVDPLFSTGIPLTLLGIERLAAMLAQGRPDPRDLAAFAATTLDEADRTAQYIAGCYAAFPPFEDFTAYSMFYFAAASFSELARRLDAPARPGRFLCADHPRFGPALTRLAPPPASPGTYFHDVAGAIDCLNVAGLGDAAKRNWYPVDLEDAVRGASKLGVRPEVVRTALEHALPPAGLGGR
jgi:FADH2 O2-dependent halogenase